MAQVGGYQVTGKIGQGGMATVYKGLQRSLNRPVAIKVLSRKLVNHPDVVQRFNRESLIIARLSHPNIITVIDRGITPEGMPYFVMEYLEGMDLGAAIRDRCLDFNRKVDISIQVCRALAYAHKNGVIHRDIKPGNILIGPEGIPRVLDFGIAQLFRSDAGDGDKTQVGLVMGTPAYMSPEQQTSAHLVTAASDLYSLGAVMYELFTGAKPVGRFPRPRELEPGLPPPLEEIILQCLATAPDQRPESADQLKDRLLLLLRGAHLEHEQRVRADQGVAAGDKFALLDVIKEDRYGAVYLYEDRTQHKLMVLKRRPADHGGYTVAKLLTTLKHPHIVNVLGTSANEQHFIIVMEYLTGGCLKDRLIQPLPWGEAVTICRNLCAGLAYAHRNRIVHGNLRPSNVLFSQDGTVKVTDFGLLEHYSGDDNWYNPASEPRSPQADLLAAGVVLHQMLTGNLPQWQGEELRLDQNLSVLPAALQEIVARMVHRNRARRYASCDQVASDLQALLITWAPPSRPTTVDQDDATQVAPASVVAANTEPIATAPGRLRRGVRPLPTLALLALLGAAALYALDVRNLVDVGHYLSPFRAAWTAFIEQGQVVLKTR